MPMVDVGHVPVLVLGAGMLVFVRMSHVSFIMCMKLIMAMSMFVNHRHVDVKMGMLLIRQ
jgi:hypothetical protein